MKKTWIVFNDRIGYFALIPVIDGKEQETGLLDTEEDIENYINNLEATNEKMKRQAERNKKS